MLQILSSVSFNLYLGTLGWWTLVWVCLISHFWMRTCLNKLSCLVSMIFSLVLWISCKLWSDIHISIAPWFSGWISWCPLCAHLRHMCADGLVLKHYGGVQINCRHGNWWWWNLYLYIWSSLVLIPVWFRISIWCCILGLTWNLYSLIFCVGKGSHWQRSAVDV